MNLSTEYRDSYGWVGQFSPSIVYGDPRNRPTNIMPQTSRPAHGNNKIYVLDTPFDIDENDFQDKIERIREIHSAQGQKNNKRSASDTSKSRSNLRRHTFDPDQNDFDYRVPGSKTPRTPNRQAISSKGKQQNFRSNKKTKGSKKKNLDFVLWKWKYSSDTS